MSRVTRLVSARAGIQIWSMWALNLLTTKKCCVFFLPPGGGAVVLGAESRASGDVAINMMDSRTSQQLQLIDEQVSTL